MFKRNKINMGKIRFRRKILRWGNGYGIRLTKTEAERLGAGAKAVVDVEIRSEPPRFDPATFRFVAMGPDASKRHTELAAEAADAGR